MDEAIIESIRESCNWKFYGLLQTKLDFKACIVWAKNVFRKFQRAVEECAKKTG